MILLGLQICNDSGEAVVEIDFFRREGCVCEAEYGCEGMLDLRESCLNFSQFCLQDVNDALLLVVFLLELLDALSQVQSRCAVPLQLHILRN